MLEDFDIPFTQEVVLVPIPMSKEKMSERTFNQSEIITEALERKFKCKIENVLERNKDSNFQHMLTKKERMENVKNSFICKKKIKWSSYYFLKYRSCIKLKSS